MGFWDWFKSNKTRGPAEAASAETTQSTTAIAAAAAGRLPVSRGNKETLAAYGDSPPVRVIVQKLAEAVASVEWHCYRVTAEPMRRKLRHATLGETRALQKLVARSLDAGNAVEVYDYLLDALDYGNRLLNGFECREVLQASFELVGESFAQIQRTPAGEPAAIWPLAPNWVEELPEATGAQGYGVRIGSSLYRVPTGDMIYLRNPNPAAPYQRGSGLGFTLRDELDTDDYVAQYTRAFFANNATPAGIVTLEGASATEVDRVAQTFDDGHRGVNRAGRLHFVNHPIDVELFNADPADASVTQIRTAYREYIRMVFGVPPEIVGVLTNSNRATIDAAEYIFARQCVMPRLDRWRRCLQRLLPEDTILVYDSPLPDNREFVLSVASAAPWSRTRGEWRALQGLEENPNGADDVYMQPMGVLEVPAGQGAPEMPENQTDEDRATAAQVETRVGPNALNTLSIDDINEIVRTMPSGVVGQALQKFWGKELAAYAKEAYEQDFGCKLPTTFPTSPLVTEHVRLFGSRMKNVDDTTKALIRESLAKSVSEGLGYDEMARNLRDVFDVSRGRAELIARTEVNTSSNFALFAAHKSSGLFDMHRWVSNFNARPDHEEAGNQPPIKLGDNFKVGNGEGPYPGQISEVGQNCNCRCYSAPVVDNSFMADLEAEQDRLQAEAAQELLAEKGAPQFETRKPKSLRFSKVELMPDKVDMDYIKLLHTATTKGGRIGGMAQKKILDRSQKRAKRWFGRTLTVTADVFDDIEKAVMKSLEDVARRKGLKT